MKRLSLFCGVVVVGTSACAFTIDDPCQEYVDYVCDCHGGEPEYDCETLRVAYAGSGEEYASECLAAHDALVLEDQQTNHECVGDTTTYYDTATSYDTGASQ